MTFSISIKIPSRRGVGLAFITACLAGTALTFPAHAQTAGGQLPEINVNSTRLSNTGSIPAGSGTVGYSAIGIVGASTSVITADDIAHSPGQTIQDVLATVPGIQVQTLFGGVNGAGTSVDLRGFGAFATANTLILINGRRVNDLDLAGVDLSTTPLQSIERIEITKGNSGAVLYGDNAVGGVINIVTKTGASTAKAAAIRAETGTGSYGQREGNISLSTNLGPWSSAALVNAVQSNGYRVNNALDQRNGVGEVRYTTPDFSAFFNLSGDDQHIGLPGGRTVTATTNLLATDRQGAATPFDFGDKQGINATTGFTKMLWNGAELIVDGGVRRKWQQGSFFGTFADNYVDTTLTTWSITPRLNIKNDVFGLRSNILTGIDYYDATYDSNRSKAIGLAPIHVYNLSQQTVAGYWQQTLGILPATDFAYGARVQNVSVSAKDTYDPTAPTQPFFSSAQDAPLNSNEIQHALHAGLEHRFNESFTVFGRVARAFRTPNVDERVSAGPHLDPFFNPIPSNFALKTQTSYDVEGGIKIHAGRLELQSSIYDMHLKNEIHFNPFAGYNLNLDPTHRYGSETSVTVTVNEALRLRGGFAYTRAVFEEGAFAGNDVPLVSRVSGNVGATWNVWQKYAVLDANVRFWGTRRMDNDQNNNQALIPANATLDLKLSGQYENFFWSAAVLNVFDALYYDYAIASQFTSGNYSAYPLPGRTYMVKAGVTF